MFAKAIIHLFPKPDALRVLAKIRNILKQDGIFYVTTTLESSTAECLRPKQDYDGSIVRFRRSWTQEELLASVEDNGFRIIETGYNEEQNRGKRWFNIWAHCCPIKNPVNTVDLGGRSIRR